MLFVSILTSDREKDPELWAVIWQGMAPPTLKLHQAYNLGGNKRVYVWEGESAADLQFMDRFNEVGVMETCPAFDATLRLAEAFAHYGIGWLEEPLADYDFKAYAELCRRSPIPIAGGEHEYTVRDFRDLAEHKAHDIWQPDATWTGGMTQMKAIYALARETGFPVCPHRGAEVWGLQAIAALDPAPLAESGRPCVTWLRNQPAIVNGFIELPERPGFGVDLAPDLLGF